MSGQDPFFRRLKEAIGEFRLTPHEAMGKAAALRGTGTPLNKERHGVEICSCGLCLTGVPCSTGNPVKR